MNFVRDGLPAVSIILATYNRRMLLERAIQSVQAQTHRQWELIVVDDGSTDDTLDFLKTAAKHDRRMRYVAALHHGRIATIQRGIAEAKEPIIAFIDSDDYYQSDHLARVLSFFEEPRRFAMVFGTPTILGDQYVPDVRDLKRRIHLRDCAIFSTFFIVAPLLKEISALLREPSFGSDYFVYQEVRRRGGQTLKIDMPTYVYDRTGSDSLTKNFTRSFVN